jgi:type IV pilus assembly protein PilE
MHTLTMRGAEPRTRNARRFAIGGFTLLELVIALAVIAVLASIAYPGYQQLVINGRRADGTTALTDLANRMERYYAQNNTFATATIATGTAATDVLPAAASRQGYYTLSITAQAQHTYTIRATRAGVQANDTKCGNFTLTSTGVKGIVGNATGYTVARCW